MSAAALLDGQMRALDGAMLVAQAAAEKGPVHKLRTSTRRMEAQLVLLEQMPDLPEHAGEATEVDRLLRRVRRAAAHVRDLDVQADLIAGDLPDAAAVHSGTRGDEILQEGEKLLKKLQRRREEEAAALMETLRAESEPLAEAMRALQERLCGEQAGAALAAVSTGELSARIQRWFAVRSARSLQRAGKAGRGRALQRLQQLDEETLHDLRKAAKQCRYMAESLPEGSAAAKKLAKRFEYLQEAGGRWHDWLMLEALAARSHGKKAALTERYRNHRDAALAEYHLQLALELTTGAHRGRRGGGQEEAAPGVGPLAG